jgi:hypothetical protein
LGYKYIMTDIGEDVNVLAFFKDNSIKPYIFFWKNRQIKVDNVNLVHTSRDGNKLFYHFSLSSGENFYRLAFDPVKMHWMLEAVEEDEQNYSSY